MSKKTDKYKSSILGDIFAEISPEEQKRTDNRMLLAAKIKDGIKAKRWQNIDLAKKLNKNPSVITKWLSGTHNFTSDTLSDIQYVLGIKLLAVEDKKEPQVIHYHLSITSNVVNDVENRMTFPTSATIYSSLKQNNLAQC